MAQQGNIHYQAPPPREVIYKWLVETSDDAILSLSSEGVVETMNRAAEEMFGYQRGEFEGQSVFQLVPLGWGGELQEKMKRVREGGAVEVFETVRMRKDGSHFPVSLRISAIRDSSGNLLGISWIARDISERRKAEGNIRKLSRVVEQTADSVMITDKAGKIEYVNPAFVRTTGYSREEVLGQGSHVLKSGKHSRLFYRTLWRTILGGKPFRGTMINRKKSGVLFYTEKTITPLLDEAGGVTHFVSTDKDVTESKLAQDHLNQVLRRFAGLFNHASDAIAYCSLDGTFVEVNPAFLKLTGYEREELVSHLRYADIVTPQSNQNWQVFLKCEFTENFKVGILSKGGAVVDAAITVFSVREGDKPTAVGMILRKAEQTDRDFIQTNLERKRPSHETAFN